MNRAQADRAVIAARASTSPRRSTGPVSRNLLARAQTLSAAPGFTGTRRHGNKRSGKGGSQSGGVSSLWRTQALDFWTDPKWSNTVSHHG